MLPQIIESRGRLVARIVREILRTESFDCLADLVEALKTRLGIMKIQVSNDDMSEAFALIETNTPLLRPPPRKVVRRVDPPPEPIGPEEAAAILTRLGIAVSVKAMPRVRELTPDAIRRRQFEADRRTAYQLVEQEMLDTAQRCDRLERRLRLVKSDREPR
jgi:hypothetical protein